MSYFDVNIQTHTCSNTGKNWLVTPTSKVMAIYSIF